jgi:hypothetical protein
MGEEIVLNTVGGYSITSKKEDECMPNWGNLCWITGIVVAIVSITTGMALVIINQDVYLSGGILIGGFGITFVLYLLPYSFTGCGVRITVNEHVTGKFASVLYRPVDTTTYKFSGDTGYDAEQIQKIVCRYTRKAYTRMTKAEDRAKLEGEKKSNDEKKKLECCIQYRSVMENIKR